MSEHKALGGRYFGWPFNFFIIFALLCGAVTLYRLVFGLGPVSDLNGGYGWGIWIAFDLLVGTGLACGGWALAWAVYVFNQQQFHPLMRSAILASLFGYCLGGFSIIIDMGRYWNTYNIYLPWQMNFNSVLIETAVCMSIYCFILILEFAPAVVEKFKLTKIKKVFDKYMFVIVSIAALLPTMHQSSMGSLFMLAGEKIHPLWQSYEMLSLFALLTAFIMGFSIVIFEGSLVASGTRGHDHSSLLAKLTNIIKGLIITYFICRFGELIYRDKLALILAGDFYSYMFILEQTLFALPLAVLWNKSLKHNARWLFIGACSVLVACILYRLNYALIAYNPGNGYSYFPTVAELLFTIGLVSIEVIGFIWLIKWTPVLPADEQHEQQTNGSASAKVSAH